MKILKNNGFVYSLGLAAIAAAALISNAQAAPDTASTTGNASATVITPITVAESVAMSYGTFAASPTIAGTLVLGTNGSVTATNVDYVSGAVPGEFNVTGTASATYAVSAISDITLTSGTDTMTISSVNTSGGTLTAGGIDTVLVGGTLNVGAGQAAGSYTGTYAVTVTYN